MSQVAYDFLKYILDNPVFMAERQEAAANIVPELQTREPGRSPRPCSKGRIDNSHGIPERKERPPTTLQPRL